LEERLDKKDRKRKEMVKERGKEEGERGKRQIGKEHKGVFGDPPHTQIFRYFYTHSYTQTH
jgi:hypothetical protein